MESRLDVLGHVLGIAADVEVPARLEPLVNLGGVLDEAMLDVDFLGLVAGKGGGELRQHARLLVLFKFLAVEEIRRRMLLSEESQFLPFAPVRGALLEERTERGDAGAGADHDDRGIQILGHAEVLRGVGENRQSGFGTLGEEGRADALTQAVAGLGLVAHDGHREVHGIADRLLRGGDGIQTRLELAQDLDEFLRCELRRRKLFEHVEEVAAPEVVVERGFLAGVEQVVEKSGGFVLERHSLEDLLAGSVMT